MFVNVTLCHFMAAWRFMDTCLALDIDRYLPHKVSVELRDPERQGYGRLWRYGCMAKKVKKDVHITLDAALLKKTRIKCVKEDLTVSQAVARLLRKWVINKSE